MHAARRLSSRCARWPHSLRDEIDQKLNPQDLKKIADLTLEHYNQRAEDFWEARIADRKILDISRPDAPSSAMQL